jgi:hypothetical protein
MNVGQANINLPGTDQAFRGPTMTENLTAPATHPEPRPSLGRTLGETSRLIGKLHHRALADFDADFPTWMLLTLLDEARAPMAVADVAAELGRRLDLPAPETLRALERSAAAGRVRYLPEADPATAELTEEGAAYFAELYAYSRNATDVAFEGIDPGDLAVVLRVMRAAGERAALALS